MWASELFAVWNIFDRKTQKTLQFIFHDCEIVLSNNYKNEASVPSTKIDQITNKVKLISYSYNRKSLYWKYGKTWKTKNACIDDLYIVISKYIYVYCLGY